MKKKSSIEKLGKEIKFLLEGYKISRILEWLNHFCINDPEYHYGIVSSIYYDTKNFDFLNEKSNSDYLKTKIRLRWYESPSEKCSEGYAFAEVKYRIGTRRDKIRIKTGYNVDLISKMPLESYELLKIPLFLKSKGIDIKHPIFPVFVVRYFRQRFIESVSGARICLDYSISVPRVNHLIIPVSNSAFLNNAVFEVKGRNGEIPCVMGTLLALGCEKASFSKYYECYKKLIGK